VGYQQRDWCSGSQALTALLFPCPMTYIHSEPPQSAADSRHEVALGGRLECGDFGAVVMCFVERAYRGVLYPLDYTHTRPSVAKH
jgi:hypothetical protein